MKLMLKELRKQAGYSQKELAEKLGVDWRTYGSWERQERALNLKQACSICNALSCTPNDLVGWPASGLTPDESDLVKCFKACNAPTRASVLMVAKNGALASTCQGEQSPIALSFDYQLNREHSETCKADHTMVTRQGKDSR